MEGREEEEEKLKKGKASDLGPHGIAVLAMEKAVEMNESGTTNQQVKRWTRLTVQPAAKESSRERDT